MPLNSLPLPAAATSKVDKAAKEFEAMFITEMFGHIFNAMEVDSTFGGGRGEEIFRGLMVQEYGKMMSHNGTGIGIAKDIKAALLKMQEAQ
jgi:Rod binding domain-containing protein